VEYPKAVVEKAKRLEQLLLRVRAGEPLAEVNEALGFELDQGQQAKLEAKYEAGGRQWAVLLDGRYGHEQKVHSGIREWLYSRKEGDEEVRAPQLAREIKEKFEVEVDPGHVNYLLRKRGLSAPVGRPYQEKGEEEEKEEPSPDVSIENAGIFFPGRGEGRVGRGRSDRRNRGDRPG
jgi:transposase